MNTYAQNRQCAEVLEKLLALRLGMKLRIRVNLDPDPRISANQQASYGLAKLDERIAKGA